MLKYEYDGERLSKKDFRQRVAEWLAIRYDAMEAFIFSQGKLEFTPIIKGRHEMTNFLEKVSGSEDYWLEYDKVNSQNSDAEADIIKWTKRMAELRKQWKKLQQMDDSVDRSVLDQRGEIDKQIDLLTLALYQK